MLRFTARRMVGRRPVSNFLREPAESTTFNETLAQCKKDNVDMAAALSSDFLLLQSKLLKYRVARVAEDIQYIRANPGKSFPSFGNLLTHCVALPILFVGGWWLGRGSLTPLIPPPQTPKTEEAKPNA